MIVGDILEREDFEVDDITHDELEAANINKLDLVGVSAIYVSYLNNSSVAHARYLVRRIRRRNARIKIIVGFWGDDANKVDGEKIVGSTRNCYFATSIEAAIEHVCG